ncbi:MAG: phosphomannomutase/phosphoglucomutase, partial [Thermoleophilaceae bacterium]|nr:phosphomannomutase/phosphoglucomutase [Thermoleophilaceae bacterium]
MPATIDPGVFKAYDVRGLYGDQIDEDVAYRIGRAFPRVLADMYDVDPGDLRLAIGRDMRLTASAMAERYAMGMREAGAHVIDIGQVG